MSRFQYRLCTVKITLANSAIFNKKFFIDQSASPNCIWLIVFLIMFILNFFVTGAWMQSNGYCNCDHGQCTFYKSSIEGRDVIATFLALLFRFGQVFRTTIILAKLFLYMACKADLYICLRHLFKRSKAHHAKATYASQTQAIKAVVIRLHTVCQGSALLLPVCFDCVRRFRMTLCRPGHMWILQSRGHIYLFIYVNVSPYK